MKIMTVFRITARVRRLVRRLTRFTVMVAVFGLLFGGLVVGKNLLIDGLKRELRKSFEFKSAEVSFVPLSLTIEDIRSISDSPLIRVKRATVVLPYISLFHNEKSVIASIIEPEVRFKPKKAGPAGKSGAKPFTLPVVLKKLEILRGRLIFEGRNEISELRGLDVMLTTKGREFDLKTSADSGTYRIISSGLEIGGAVNLWITGRQDEARVRDLSIKGPLIDLKASGPLRNILKPEFELDSEMDLDVSALSSYLRLPFELGGRAKARGRIDRGQGKISVKAGLTSEEVTVEGVVMGVLSGDLDLKFGGSSRVVLAFEHPSGVRQDLNIEIVGGQVLGKIDSLYLDPVMKEIGVPWPVKSLAWGKFEFGRKKLSVEGELRDGRLNEAGGKFPLAGRVKANVDFSTGDIVVESSDIRSSFGRLEARSHWLPGGDIEADIRGTISDLKRGREFLALMLKTNFGFPEIRGSGYADIKVKGRAKAPEVSFSGAFSPGGFDTLNASFVEGDGLISGSGFNGRFRIDDPELKGLLTVESGREATRLRVTGGDGELDSILPALGLVLPLHGRVAGDFTAAIKGAETEVDGTFTSPKLLMAGIETSDVKSRLEWKNSIVTFPDLSFGAYGGRIEGRLALGQGGEYYDMDLRGEGLDLALLDSGSKGVISFNALGKGRFGENRVPVKFGIKDLVYSPIQKADLSGELLFDYVNGDILLDGEAGLLPGDNGVKVSVKVPTGAAPVDGKITGYFTDLDLVAPWKGAKGRADFTTTLSGPREAIVSSIAVEFKGAVLPLPGFAHAVEDYSGSLMIAGGRLVLQEFAGRLGGGKVTGAGEFQLTAGSVTGMDLRLEGTGMQLSPVERVRALVDGTARLVKDSRQFVLEGDFLLANVIWRRDLSEKFEFMTTVGAQGPAGPRTPSFFDGVTLNIRLRSRGGALMDNSLGRLTARFDLSLTGSMDAPVILGDLEIEKGTVLFQDHTFRLLGGRVSFSNPGSLDPYLELRGETFVKDYRITMNLTGPASRMRPEFTSSPPLQSEEVLALLALGESYERMYSSERNTTQSTASLISYQLSGQAKKTTQGVFSLDRFRIDPLVSESSSEMSARLTLGKKLSKNVLLIYSTTLASQRKEIYRMEWSLGRDFTLVAVRDEQERIAFDLKIRKRF